MKKILIANRGEIAVRIIRACKELGIQTVAVYSTADAKALHVLLADESVCIGEASAKRSYLHIPSILAAAELTGADAIHPGYGFLSENERFARLVKDSGLIFIGPSSEAIALLGDKTAAKDIARACGVPVIPGSLGVVSSPQEAIDIAENIGFPVLIKASAGGGGKGIRIVENSEELPSKFAAAKAEALAAFGNDDVYIEKKIINPRHIEIQVLADLFDNVVHLGERDCTIQRRRQKLIEEAPSPMLSTTLRSQIGESAKAIIRKAHYHTAATVEFLLDQEGNFYFMEVNTRVQVEHTVTEELTGIDIVKEQIALANKNPLSFRQEDVVLSGHVIQFRINAEDSLHNFAPSPGTIEYFIPPLGPHVRIDTACYSGYVVPPHYDSMIAKLIVKGKTREQALAIAKRALEEFYIGGIATTIPFHKWMISDPTFISGLGYPITYVDTLVEQGCSFEEAKVETADIAN